MFSLLTFVCMCHANLVNEDQSYQLHEQTFSSLMMEHNGYMVDLHDVLDTWLKHEVLLLSFQ